jgi:hypothetical protein
MTSVIAGHRIEYSIDPDVNEDSILKADEGLLRLLLRDHTTEKNILWMTDNYVALGKGYESNSQIFIPLITGSNSEVIKPRTSKSTEEQRHRIRDKAEVFTPLWICNQQNNLIDSAWFGRNDVFNKETKKGWITNRKKINFPELKNKTWQSYILSPRIEVSCGEAPYLVTRYDPTSGEVLPVEERVGLLDRKLRIVSENTVRRDTWQNWSLKAIQSIYGYEWQGDNLLLARENLILSYIDHYTLRFAGEYPPFELLREVAEIVSWNLWQMDGTKYVVPMSCQTKDIIDRDLFEERVIKKSCEGCRTGTKNKHNGQYCLIKDWQKNEVIAAISLGKEKRDGQKI